MGQYISLFLPGMFRGALESKEDRRGGLMNTALPHLEAWCQGARIMSSWDWAKAYNFVSGPAV